MKHKLEVDSVLLEFRNRRILQDVYLKLETGKVTGILGRNGSGKSCLMNVIFGELLFNNSSVRIDGQYLSKQVRSIKTMRYLPQFNFIPKSLNVKRVFKDFKLDFSDFINTFPDFEKHYKTNLDYLSGGQKRIIEVYAILVAEAKFCLLDEPFSHIMPVHVDAIKKIILREKKNKGILISDHLYKHILELSDALYVLKDGKTYLTKSKKEVETLGYARIETEKDSTDI